MKTWQQLIQSKTPNGLTAPSLGGASAANNKTEQLSSDGHQRPNIVDSSQRRKSISSSREGTPSQSAIVGESLASKSGPPPTATHSHKDASRTPTPTPTPSPRPPATPSSSTPSSSPPSIPQVPASVPTPPQPAIIPRPTKAQDFARNRIRRMQMLAHVSPQSQKPLPPPSAATATTSSTIQSEDLQKQQEANKPQHQQQEQSGTPNSQSLSSQSQIPPAAPGGIESPHNSSIRAPSFISQSEHSSTTSNFVVNGSHFKATSDSNSLSHSTSSQSSASVKFMNAHSRTAPSLSQMVTNSVNHHNLSSSNEFESRSFTTPSSNSVSQASIARKIGVKGSLGKSSHKRLETPPPPTPESLIVRIPRNHVHISPRNRELCEAQGLHHDFSTESAWSSSQALPSEEEFSLIVSIDLSLLRRVSNHHQQAIHGLDIEAKRTEWLIENHYTPAASMNMEPPTNSINDSEPMETEPITSFGNGGIPLHPLTPGLQVVPTGASLGVDGYMGSDGCWYSWTDPIPGHDAAVTIMPYIYIDDEESDSMQIFSN